MISIVRSLYRLLIPAERRAMRWLFVLACALTGLELLGVGSFFWYMTIVTEPVRVASDPVIRAIAPLRSIQRTDVLLLVLGMGVFLVMVVRGALAATNLYAQARFALRVRNRLSLDVLQRYLTMPYEEAIATNSAVLTKHLLVEVGNTVACIQQALLLATEVCIAIALVVLVAVIDPFLVLLVVGGLGVLTTATIVMTRRRIAAYGRALETCNAKLFQASAQALQGAKEIRAFDATATFLHAFRVPLEHSAAINVRYEVWSGVPGMLMNLVAFGTLLVVLLTILARGGAVATALPTIVTLAFVLQRLLPSANRLYNGIALIRKYEPGIAIVREVVARAAPSVPTALRSPPPFTRELRCHDIRFTYRGSDHPVLRGVSLVLPHRGTLGIVGASGTGKSTLVDILLGLLEPTGGSITCDDTPLDGERRLALRRIVGYVPQQTFLLDDTIRANVAFGVPVPAIDDARVMHVLRTAQLDPFVAALSVGIGTTIGERGIRLSGGQRQRLGIARALYRNPAILILDEATSALDPETERAFLSALDALRGAVTIIVVAHRLSTLRACTQIAFLDGGRIAGIGTLAALAASCPAFRERYLVGAGGGSRLMDSDVVAAGVEAASAVS